MPEHLVELLRSDATAANAYARWYQAQPQDPAVSFPDPFQAFCDLHEDELRPLLPLLGG